MQTTTDTARHLPTFLLTFLAGILTQFAKSVSLSAESSSPSSYDNMSSSFWLVKKFFTCINVLGTSLSLSLFLFNYNWFDPWSLPSLKVMVYLTPLPSFTYKELVAILEKNTLFIAASLQ